MTQSGVTWQAQRRAQGMRVMWCGICHLVHVWHLPPSACVYVTHDTWRMKSKCEESEKLFSLWDQTKER